MPNVEQLQRRIGDRLSFNPNTKRHRTTILNRLNDALRKLVLSKEWTFRRRDVDLHWPADKTWAESVLTDGNNFLEVASAVSTATYHYFPAWSQGGILDMTSAGTGWDALAGGPGIGSAAAPLDYFKVERAAASSTTLKLWMEHRWPTFPPRNISDTGQVTLRVHRLLLPWDCDQVYGVSDFDNDRGELIALGSRRDIETKLRDLDDTGPPTYYMVSNGERGADPYGEDHYPEFLRRAQLSIDAPLDLAFATSTPSGSGSGLLAGDYEFCYTWEWGGIESGPSKVVEATIATDGQNFTLTGMERYENGYQGGRYRRVYWRFNESPWVLLTTMTDPTVTSLDVGATTGGNGFAPRRDDVDYPRLRHGRHGRLAQWLRVWPRPAEDTRLVLHYLAGAQELEHPRDVPQIPEIMQDLLVHQVVLQYLSEKPSEDNAVSIRETKAEIRQLMSVANSRYLHHGNQRKTRRSCHAGEGRFPGFTISSISYTG